MVYFMDLIANVIEYVSENNLNEFIFSLYLQLANPHY